MAPVVRVGLFFLCILIAQVPAGAEHIPIGGMAASTLESMPERQVRRHAAMEITALGEVTALAEGAAEVHAAHAHVVKHGQKVTTATTTIREYMEPTDGKRSDHHDTAFVACAHSALALPLDAPFVNASGGLWVVHYSKDLSRRARLESILRHSPSIAVNWLDNFDREQMTPEGCRCLFHDQFQKCSGPIDYIAANAWAQYALYLHIIMAKIDYVYIMEDDPMFRSTEAEQQFGQDLREMMASAGSLLSGNFDMIHFGGCLNRHGTVHVGGRFWKMAPRSPWFGRCTNGYVVSQRGAAKMLSVFSNSNDFKAKQSRIFASVGQMFNYLGAALHLDVVMYEPPLFNNGFKGSAQRPEGKEGLGGV